MQVENGAQVADQMRTQRRTRDDRSANLGAVVVHHEQDFPSPVASTRIRVDAGGRWIGTAHGYALLETLRRAPAG